jgi:hypothetical protein
MTTCFRRGSKEMTTSSGVLKPACRGLRNILMFSPPRCHPDRQPIFSCHPDRQPLSSVILTGVRRQPNGVEGPPSAFTPGKNV